jgi:hypothetical protein
VRSFTDPIAMTKDDRKSTFREGRAASGGPDGVRGPAAPGGPRAAQGSTAAITSPCRMPAGGFLTRRTLYLVLLFLSCAPYRGILDNWLFNDDFSWLRAARFDMTPVNILTFRVVEFFRPLVNLSFFVMEKAAPGNVPLQYACNLALHALCTLLVFHLILNLLRNERLAAAAAALFALTSVHAAAILWMSARTTLLSTFFLLASLTMLTSSAGTVILRVAAAIALYILGLASKEEAISGVFLVGLLFALGRKAAGFPRERSKKSNGGTIPDPSPADASTTGTRGIPLKTAGNALSPASFAAFAAVSVLYLVVRHAFMGGIFRENWGLGFHTIRNVAGGFLFQLYPWPFFSLFYPRGTHLPAPAGALMPEILVVPLVLFLIWAGRAAKKSYAATLAVGWALLSLLPESSFRYRFFSTVSISQDRYYYLSSVGTTLLVVLLLSMLWHARSRLRQGIAVGIFIILCAGYVLRDARLERKWDAFTRMYREVVAAISEESGAFSGTTTLAIEGAPLAFPYLGDAIALEMPGWKAVEVKGGKAEAERFAPCLYVSYTGTKPKLMRMEKIERALERNGATKSGSMIRGPAKVGAS